MSRVSVPVITYRWITFLLAIGYVAYQFGTGDWSNPGGPLRFLTIWALVLSAYSAWRMLSISLGKSDHPYEVPAMTASVFNIMVVYLYWKLFLINPDLVNGNGPIIWHQEYYLHGLGPALQLIDAVFIGQVFRRIWRGAAVLLLMVPIYVLWAEMFVQPLNDTPVGSVTSGLPYPFLNNMEWPARAEFYVLYGGIALAILTALSGVGWVVKRSRSTVGSAKRPPV
ncbi:hypothetical protein R3X27_16380 [Tropicimonas sp. TH_r6]|uniref:hypothetical protein n=1 Tax=Tropicimonas sp. TH_r6 TaxID=3082085 RepID=UPI002953B8F7|nr:hypothetical protein [Tropicimonas sp. TH_r6]MDV7144263.1 hypothetical protein [Tropicimonas sp. TH_r6]